MESGGDFGHFPPSVMTLCLQPNQYLNAAPSPSPDYPLKIVGNSEFRPYRHPSIPVTAAGLLADLDKHGHLLNGHPPKNIKSLLADSEQQRKMRHPPSAGLGAASGPSGGVIQGSSLVPPWFLHQHQQQGKRRQLSESASGKHS